MCTSTESLISTANPLDSTKNCKKDTQSRNVYQFLIILNTSSSSTKFCKLYLLTTFVIFVVIAIQLHQSFLQRPNHLLGTLLPASEAPHFSILRSSDKQR